MGRVLFAFVATGLFAQDPSMRLTEVASGVNAPTDIQHAGDGSGRLFFVQQNGIVRIYRNGGLAAQPFLDIRTKTVVDSERGLLGLAFPPGFAQKQRFYVNYTDRSGDTVIAMYRVSANPDIADAASEVILLTIDQPFANHNGGQLRFGPDGYLYIGMGDGGSAGDPQNFAQNRGSLLGKMLRIDVESAPGQIRVPPDNPFVNQAGTRPEIWALGLRNPWRFSFDRATSDLWIADVGQNIWEEVNFQPAASTGGENYGWAQMEGFHCFRPACNMTGFVLPVAEYNHAVDGCSVTGGHVYRGAGSPGLRGTYLYGDYCSGRIWGIRREAGQFVNRFLLPTAALITTFGEDEQGEVYLGDARANRIYRVDGSAAPRVIASGVVNAASFTPGLVAGSLATVFAAGVLDEEGLLGASSLPLPSSLGNVSVSVNGINAPIHVIANRNGQEQVNFQVPFEVTGTTATVVVTRAGAASSPVQVPLFDSQPAVYTLDGTEAVAVHNADYSLVTAERPLDRNEYAFIYAAGLGRVSNPPATGAGALVSPLSEVLGGVQVTIAGQASDVQFAGLAPGLAGVFQVNFRVGGSAPSGLQDLVLTAGGISSPPVKIRVR